MKSLKSLIIYRVLSANHGSWTPPPAVELIWSVNTMQKGFRPGFNQVTETIYWKSWVLKDVPNRITSFAVPETCKNRSKSVSKANASFETDNFSWSKKGEKKSRGCSLTQATKPWPGPIESIKNTKSGSQKSKLAPYRRSLCKLRSSREQDVWAGCKIESPYRDLRRIETEGGSMNGLA